MAMKIISERLVLIVLGFKWTDSATNWAACPGLTGSLVTDRSTGVKGGELRDWNVWGVSRLPNTGWDSEG